MLYLQLQKLLPKRLAVTVVEIQQLPNIEKTDSKEEKCYLQWTVYNARRKVCVNFQTDRDKLIIVVHSYRISLNLRDKEFDLKMRENHFWQNEFISWAKLTYCTSGGLYRMKQLFKFETNSVVNECRFLMSNFRLYSGIKMSFGHNCLSKNLFLSACFCWDSRLSLREMDQKFKFGGTIGYGNSYLEFLFRHFRVFRLHTILHDAAGAVRAHHGKGPG